jgi:hypothetical protein
LSKDDSRDDSGSPAGLGSACSGAVRASRDRMVVIGKPW